MKKIKQENERAALLILKLIRPGRYDWLKDKTILLELIYLSCRKDDFLEFATAMADPSQLAEFAIQQDDHEMAKEQIAAGLKSGEGTFSPDLLEWTDIHHREQTMAVRRHMADYLNQSSRGIHRWEGRNPGPDLDFLYNRDSPEIAASWYSSLMGSTGLCRDTYRTLHLLMMLGDPLANQALIELTRKLKDPRFSTDPTLKIDLYLHPLLDPDVLAGFLAALRDRDIPFSYNSRDLDFIINKAADGGNFLCEVMADAVSLKVKSGDFLHSAMNFRLLAMCGLGKELVEILGNKERAERRQVLVKILVHSLKHPLPAGSRDHVFRMADALVRTSPGPLAEKIDEPCFHGVVVKEIIQVAHPLLTVKFSNGEVVTLNVGKALRKKNTAGVRYIMDPANFHKVVVKDFTATWDNGVGFDPDRMYLIWPRGEAPQS